MAHPYVRRLAALSLLGWSAGAAGQQAPLTESDPILVTGVRNGSTVGIVSYDKVWRQCAECKRALAKLALLSKPYHLKKGEIRRDAESFVESVGKHARDESQAKRFLDRLPDIQRKDTDELRIIRFDMQKLIASFLAQLEPVARAAAEEERVAQGLPAVFDSNGKAPPAKVKTVPLTEAVIRRLDGMKFEIALPTPEQIARHSSRP